MNSLTPKAAYKIMLKEYPDILSFEQMCNALNISPKTGYKLLKERQVIGIKVGRSYRIPKAHIL